MCAQSYGKEVLFFCDKDIGNALSATFQFDADVDTMHLVKAAEKAVTEFLQ